MNSVMKTKLMFFFLKQYLLSKNTVTLTEYLSVGIIIGSQYTFDKIHTREPGVKSRCNDIINNVFPYTITLNYSIEMIWR